MEAFCPDCGSDLKEYEAGYPGNYRGYCRKCAVMWCAPVKTLKKLLAKPEQSRGT